MTMLDCTRCAQHGERLPFRPFQNAIGLKVFEGICTDCWAAWLKHQTALINHYGLDVRDPKAKEFLFAQMEEFLFTSAPQS